LGTSARLAYNFDSIFTGNSRRTACSGEGGIRTHAPLRTNGFQDRLVLLVMAFLISPFGLPKLAFWLLGKVQDLKFAIQDLVYS